jgi:hypothetical protein
LINKVSGSGVFTEDDEDVMSIFLAIAGPILAESNLYEQIQGKSKGRGVEGVGGEGIESAKPPELHHGASAKGKVLPGFSEEGEGDGEED